MSIDPDNEFAEVLQHYGHEIVIAKYPAMGKPESVSIECETSHCVLFDFNAPEEPEPEPHDGIVCPSALENQCQEAWESKFGPNGTHRR